MFIVTEYGREKIKTKKNKMRQKIKNRCKVFLKRINTKKKKKNLFKKNFFFWFAFFFFFFLLFIYLTSLLIANVLLVCKAAVKITSNDQAINA